MSMDANDGAREASEIREVIRERSRSVPAAAREELFGKEELGPSFVLDTVGQPLAFRGLGGTMNGTSLRDVLAERVDAIENDPRGAAKQFDELVKHHRGVTPG